jgi:hypothetical protein
MLERNVRSSAIRLRSLISHAVLPQPKMKDKVTAEARVFGKSRSRGRCRLAPTAEVERRTRSLHEVAEAASVARAVVAEDRGRGRGRGTGTGKGRAEVEATFGGGGDRARDQAWKGKNKARQANHDRKRGHDKKMSKAGGPS